MERKNDYLKRCRKSILTKLNIYHNKIFQETRYWKIEKSAYNILLPKALYNFCCSYALYSPLASYIGIHSFSVLSTYYVAGTILGSGDTVVSKIIEILCPRGVYILADEYSSSELPAPSAQWSFIWNSCSFWHRTSEGHAGASLSNFSPPVYVTLTYLSDSTLRVTSVRRSSLISPPDETPLLYDLLLRTFLLVIALTARSVVGYWLTSESAMDNLFCEDRGSVFTQRYH